MEKQKIDKQLKPKISNIAGEYGLILVILYGSHATGKERKESDIDIAVLGKEPIKFDALIDLNNEFAEIFETKNIDVKSLHFTDPLFRYEAARKGILLYGEAGFYNRFKAYAFRDYNDSRDLFQLKDVIIKKRLENLPRRSL